MGNWFATMIGVIVGIPIALEINRIQQKKKQKIEMKNKEEENKKKISIYIDRLYNELLDNKDQIKELRNALKGSQSSRTDLWNWAKTIVNSFSFNSYYDYQNSGIQKLIPSDVEESIFYAFMDIKEIFNKVKQASAAHEFYYGYSGAGKDQSDKKFNQLQDLFCHIDLKLKQLLKSISTFNQSLGNNT